MEPDPIATLPSAVAPYPARSPTGPASTSLTRATGTRRGPCGLRPSGRVAPPAGRGHDAAVELALVHDGVNQRNSDVLDQVAEGQFARLARHWVGPFHSAFPDFRMEIADLIAEGDTVVAHFKCSGTHEGAWLGMAPTGRRFGDVDEIYIFRIKDGKLSSAIGVEDNLPRMRQLGLQPL